MGRGEEALARALQAALAAAPRYAACPALSAEVPAAEMLGIEQQIARLTEVEGLAAEWALQADAQEEVERLLRAS